MAPVNSSADIGLGPVRKPLAAFTAADLVDLWTRADVAAAHSELVAVFGRLRSALFTHRVATVGELPPAVFTAAVWA